MTHDSPPAVRRPASRTAVVLGAAGGSAGQHACPARPAASTTRASGQPGQSRGRPPLAQHWIQRCRRQARLPVLGVASCYCCRCYCSPRWVSCCCASLAARLHSRCPQAPRPRPCSRWPEPHRSREGLWGFRRAWLRVKGLGGCRLWKHPKRHKSHAGHATAKFHAGHALPSSLDLAFDCRRTLHPGAPSPIPAMLQPYLGPPGLDCRKTLHPGAPPRPPPPPPVPCWIPVGPAAPVPPAPVPPLGLTSAGPLPARPPCLLLPPRLPRLASSSGRSCMCGGRGKGGGGAGVGK